MFKYYNANPLGLKVSDCAVRAYSLAMNISWDSAYRELSEEARIQGYTFTEMKFLDKFLSEKFEKYKDLKLYRVRDFIEDKSYGVWLITMKDHITCIIDGVIYDTFNPEDRIIYDIYRVK